MILTIGKHCCYQLESSEEVDCELLGEVLSVEVSVDSLEDDLSFFIAWNIVENAPLMAWPASLNACPTSELLPLASRSRCCLFAA